jgi:MFS family permease
VSKRPAGYIELLVVNPTFRRFFAARVVSLLGDWFNTLAVLALLRAIGGGGALEFGWVLILKTAPVLFMAPIAGVVVDRLPRKALLVGGDVLSAVIVLCLFGLEQHPNVGLLYGLIVVLTAVRAVSEPARSAVLPDIVQREDLVTANAMSAAAWSTMFTVGVAIGGVVTAWFGWKIALAVDVATYLVSAALVGTLAIPEVPREARAERRAGTFMGGLRYMAARPRVWTLALCKAGWSVAGAITLVLTILGERVYLEQVRGWGDMDPALLAVSILYMARGLGTGLGGTDPVRAEKVIAVSYVWAAGCYMAMGQVDVLGLAALLLVLAHLGGATVWVFSTVRLQAIVPTEVRGRVFANEQGAFTLTMGTSTYLFSKAIDLEWAPLADVVSTLGVLMIIPSILWLLRGRVLGYGLPSPEPAPVRDSLPDEVSS